ncbi:MAG: short-chain dehydrogenase, partial [Acidimicrobiaceae bacterium]|nr:short-chain dehydrogenase [Acidimicrobiaceae bacterium]
EKDPKNVSPLVVWLSSKECNVTGKIFEVSGGKINLCDGWRHGPSEEVEGRKFEVNEISETVNRLMEKISPPESVYGSR